MIETSDKNNYVWIFHGNGGRFASAVFQEKIAAESWIQQHSLSGILTEYPLNIGVYEWAIENQYFTPKQETHKRSEFIQKFTGGQEHYHYTNGNVG